MISTRRTLVGLLLGSAFWMTEAFVPHGATRNNVFATSTAASSLVSIGHRSYKLSKSTLDMMMDPSQAFMDASAIASSFFQDSGVGASNFLLSFSDQGQNLAGIFFQSSLLPYLVFLYFLSFRANQVPALGNFGFQFLLLFVLSTIPSGIISKSVYGFSLADTDYLHGGAELLLTVTNILIVLGFKEAMTKREPAPVNKPRNIALAIAALFAALCAIGPTIFPGHAPFLFGFGNFPLDQVAQFPWVTHAEPANALSIPTWAIHFSSVYEFLFAMGLVWRYAETTGNERWKGLTWGMLPLHASGICACTYHFFYNPPSLQFLVTAQAGLTLLGNITLMLAAFRIAQSNGWSVQELIPVFNKSTNPQGLVADGLAMKPLILKEDTTQSNTDLAINLAVVTLVTSYIVKYGELGLDLPFTANPLTAGAIILAIPAATGYYYYSKSKSEGEWNPMFFFPKIPMPGQSEGGPSLSMADVKKYGVAGTVAYVLTELAFWLVAFPVAGVALYKSTGHWPDIVNDTNDRAAVLAFIFAGANIARAFVPVRLGAALALAPWVDDNILNRIKSADPTDGETKEEAAAPPVITTKATVAPRPPAAAVMPIVQKQEPPAPTKAEEPEPINIPPPPTPPPVAKSPFLTDFFGSLKSMMPSSPALVTKSPSLDDAFASFKSKIPSFRMPSAAARAPIGKNVVVPPSPPIAAVPEPVATVSEKPVASICKPVLPSPLAADKNEKLQVSGEIIEPVEVLPTRETAEPKEDASSVPFFMRVDDSLPRIK